VHKDELILFGGILEVTKESDEVFILNLPTLEWRRFDVAEPGSPTIDRSFTRKGSNVSNSKQKTNLKASGNAASQPLLPTSTLDGTLNGSKSTKHLINSMIKQQTRKPKGSPSRNTAFQARIQAYHKSRDTLATPTSVSMKNAFIMKNMKASQDQYAQVLKRRKAKMNLSVGSTTQMEGQTVNAA